MLDIALWWWGNDDRHQATLNMIKNFESENPKIDIKAEYMLGLVHWKKSYDDVNGASRQLPTLCSLTGHKSRFSQKAMVL